MPWPQGGQLLECCSYLEAFTCETRCVLGALLSNSLSREAVGAPSLEVSKARLDGALSNLV